MCRHRKSKAHVHATAVMLHCRIKELFELGKRYYLVEFLADLALRHAEDSAVEKDILTPGQFRVKPSPDLKQAGDSPAQHNPSLGWLRDAAEDLEQRAFAGAVSSNDANDIAPLDV